MKRVPEEVVTKEGAGRMGARVGAGRGGSWGGCQKRWELRTG